MADLVNIPELAVDMHKRHFATHSDMDLWKVMLVTVGHSFNVGPEGQPLYVPRETSLLTLQEAVHNRPGLYRLIQCTAAGEELGGHVAYVEIHARNVASERQGYTIESAVAIADRMARTSEQCIAHMANLTNTLMTTHVQLQTGSARLLEAATGAIRVTSGIERIERDKPIDVGEICAQLVAALEEREPETAPEAPEAPPEHWVAQLVNGPLGKTATMFLNLYAQSIAKQMMRKQTKGESEE